MSCSNTQPDPTQVLANLVELLGAQAGGADKDDDNRQVDEVLSQARALVAESLTSGKWSVAMILIDSIVRGLETSDDDLVANAYNAARGLLAREGGR